MLPSLLDFSQGELSSAESLPRSNSGTTALHYAAREALDDLLRMLLSKFNVNEHNYYGETPLHWACHSELSTITLLINNKADVNVCDNDGNSPLHWACQEDNLPAVKLLISCGAEVDAENDDFETPIEIACQNGSRKAFRYLLSQTSDTCDLMNLACQYDQAKILKILLQSSLFRPSNEQLFSALQTASACKRKDCKNVLAKQCKLNKNEIF